MAIENRRRLLYYFAPVDELDAIIAARQLPVDDSRPARPAGLIRRRQPSLVWLTDMADLPPQQARGVAAVRPGLRTPAGSLARITVSVDDAQHWPLWARRHWITPRGRKDVEVAAGGISGRWWVVPRAIPAREWVKIERTGRWESGRPS